MMGVVPGLLGWPKTTERACINHLTHGRKRSGHEPNFPSSEGTKSSKMIPVEPRGSGSRITLIFTSLYSCAFSLLDNGRILRALFSELGGVSVERQYMPDDAVKQCAIRRGVTMCRTSSSAIMQLRRTGGKSAAVRQDAITLNVSQCAQGRRFKENR
jgi:hypothetical protein